MQWLLNFIRPFRRLPKRDFEHEAIIRETKKVIAGTDESSMQVNELKKHHKQQLRKFQKRTKIIMQEAQDLDVAIGIALSQGAHE